MTRYSTRDSWRTVPHQYPCQGQTIYVEHVPVWVCNHYGEEYFDAKVYQHLEAIARQKERIQRETSFPLAAFEMVAV